MKLAVVHIRVPHRLLAPVIESPRRYCAAVTVLEHVTISYSDPWFTSSLAGDTLSFLQPRRTASI